MGWESKRVSPPGQEPWIMLLGIDFANNRAFGWDLDVDKAKMQDVQAKILRYAQDNDLMAVSWTDNGGPSKNILEEVLVEAFGMQSRHIAHIPFGHPQSNGLVEVYSGVLDIAHGGRREQLPSALVAHNNPPRPPLESPEVMWRALRPLQSRWRGLALREAIKGRQVLSDAEWKQFLADNSKKCDAKDRADAEQCSDRRLEGALTVCRFSPQGTAALLWCTRGRALNKKMNSSKSPFYSYCSFMLYSHACAHLLALPRVLRRKGSDAVLSNPPLLRSSVPPRGVWIKL
jgi:hypothetical protein